jgi:hypothetical protein
MSHAPRPHVTRNLVFFFGSNTARTGLVMVAGFILTPLQIGAFGLVLFGLYQLLNQLSMALTVPLRAAITRTIVKSIIEVRDRDGGAGVEREFTNGVGLVLGISVAMLVVAGAAIAYLPDLLNFPEPQTRALSIAFACQAIVFAATMATTPWLSLYLVLHRPIAYNADVTVLRILDLVAFGLAVLQTGEDIFVTFVVARMALTVLHCGVRLVLTWTTLAHARFRLRSLCKETSRRLIHIGSLTMSQPIGNVMFFFLDSYLLNIVYGPVYNAIWGIVNQLRGYARRIGSEGFAGMEATVADMHERGGHDVNIRAMLAVTRITSGAMILCTGMVAIFFRPLIDLWLGAQLRSDEALTSLMSYDEALSLVWSIVVLLLIGGIFLEIAQVGSQFLFGMGHVKRYAGIMYAAAATKLVLSISIVFMVLQMAAGKAPAPESVLLFPAATLLVQLVFFGFVFPRRLLNLTQIRVSTYAWCALGRPALAAAPPILSALLIVWLIKDWSWPLLIAMVAVVGLISIPCVLGILIKRDERVRFLEMIRSGRTAARVGGPDAQGGGSPT